MSQLDYSILGPLSVHFSGDREPIVLSEKPSLLLARLLIEPGTVVPATTLANDVWDEEKELRDPANSVQQLVRHVRQKLDDTAEPRRTLQSIGTAYRIAAEPLSIDAERFRLLTRRGRALL
jgi:DNA-binding response OmpR family regulator